jgi:hypothetical protein
MLATAHPVWLRLGAGCLAGLILLATVVILVTTARRPGGRPMAVARTGSVAAGLGLVALSLSGLMPRWGIALSCFALLAAVQAIALEFGQAEALRKYLAPTGSGDDPVWWPEFERRLRRYERRRRRPDRRR